MARVITILGSTGSIGKSALDVIGLHSDDFELKALTANTNVETLSQQCLQWRPRYAVMCDENAAQQLD